MTEDFNAAVGRRIAAYRRAAGLSAQQLADRVPGLSRSGLAKIEAGIRAVLPADLLLEIAFALEVTPAAILFPLEEPSATVVVGGHEHRAADLFPWMVGESGERDTDRLARSGELFVSFARSSTRAARDVARAEAEAGESGAEAGSPDVREAHAVLRNLHKGTRWAWRNLPGNRRHGADEVDSGDD